jgi:hypothetical protein
MCTEASAVDPPPQRATDITDLPADDSQHGRTEQQALEALPKTEQESLWSAFAAARRAVQPLSAHEASLPHNAGVRYFAQNPGQKLTARFLDGGTRIESGRGGTWAATLSLVGASDTRPVLSQGRVEYRHANGITEWYENRSEGLEHAFIVSKRLDESAPKLHLSLEVEGVESYLDEGDRAGTATFVDPSTGGAVLCYGALKVWDATGSELAAHYETNPLGLNIVVADAGAVYPLTIDPLITSEEDKLGPQVTGDGPAGGFGVSLALDGNTALFGASQDDTAAGTDAGSAYVFTRNGEEWTQQAKLIPSDAAVLDRFGSSVALFGNTALIGARDDTTTAARGAGSAYVFTRSGVAWSQQAKLTASDAAYNDYFGVSVALFGDTALVGAHYDDTDAAGDGGSAYVFTRSGSEWIQQAKLEADDATSGDHFGISVALSGDTALVGAYQDDVGGYRSSGSAYIFTRSGTEWSQQAKLTSDTPSTSIYFGLSVALSEQTALVGAPGDRSGSAYVFKWNGSEWLQQAELISVDAAFGSELGTSVALSGDTALLGAPEDDTSAGQETGSAYIFQRSGATWSQQARLTAADGRPRDRFGKAVALSGDTALVGTPYETTPVGTISVFVRSGTVWAQQALLSLGDSAAYDKFGTSVAISGDTALVGAPFDDTAAGIDTGTAYVFTRNEHAWSHQARLTAEIAVANAGFGRSVALQESTAMVGAPSDRTSPYQENGSAYVFTRSGTEWEQQAKLEGHDTLGNAGFGGSVALSGDTALVGASQEDIAAQSGAGSAYVFTRSGTGWAFQAKLVADDFGSNDQFGYSVGLSGDTALVGATGTDRDAGSAYIYTRSGADWDQQAKLGADNPASSDRFGCSVALSGEIAIVGAHGTDGWGKKDSGVAYAYARSGTAWTQEAVLAAGYSDATVDDHLGQSVALSGTIALVGAPAESASAIGGGAYIFTRRDGGWSRQGELTASDSEPGDQFGYSVALSGNTALVGALGDDTLHPVTDDPRTDHGSVYVFRFEYPQISIEDDSSTPLVDGSGFIFGSAVLGSSVTRDFTIRNLGVSNLTVSEVSLGGGNGADFSLAYSSGAPIPPGGSHPFNVTFEPTVAGFRFQFLVIRSDDPGNNVFIFSLNGTGNQPPTFSGYSFSTPWQTPASLSLTKLLTSAADPDGHALVVSAAGPASAEGGTATLQAGSILYTPPASFSGADSFPVTISDELGAAVVGTVAVMVGPAPGNGGDSVTNPAQITNHPDGKKDLLFQGIPGRTYRIERSTDMTAWTTIATVAASPTGQVTFTDEDPPPGSAFYRIAW